LLEEVAERATRALRQPSQGRDEPTDSNSDSDTGGSRRSTTSGCARGAQVANAYERL
jgi:hypothetical protein